jgi:hypothetical protein
MRPAALTNLVCRVGVETLARAQSLDQPVAELSLVGILVALGINLPQPLSRSADHEIPELRAVAAATQCVERLPYGGRFGDRATRMTSRHEA